MATLTKAFKMYLPCSPNVLLGIYLKERIQDALRDGSLRILLKWFTIVRPQKICTWKPNNSEWVIQSIHAVESCAVPENVVAREQLFIWKDICDAFYVSVK